MNILGIDIGGSKISVGMIDGAGNVLCSEKEQLPAGTTADSLLCAIKNKCDIVFDKYNFNVNDFGKIGVTIPGLTDAKNGIWVYAPFSGISNFPIAEKINEIYGYNKKVYIENDVNACAVGEKRFGCCKDINDFIWVTVSNGIGGSVFINGRLYAGHNGNAGEIGHIKVCDDNNFACGCGDYGCLEAVAAGPGIAKRYNNINKSDLTAEQIAAEARAGNSAAVKTMYDTGWYIGKALSAAINILNPEMTVFGGGVSQSFDLIEPGIKDALEKYLFKAANKNIKLRQTALAYNAALIGAAAITF